MDGRVIRCCAVHGNNFWAAYTSRSFGGRFFCPGYLREDLFRNFNPQPYRPPVIGEPENDGVVRLIDGSDSLFIVVARDGDTLELRKLGLPDALTFTMPISACWPGRYVHPSRDTCWI
jgi:hypothetical protein